jgi:hypothetical protein
MHPHYLPPQTRLMRQRAHQLAYTQPAAPDACPWPVPFRCRPTLHLAAPAGRLARGVRLGSTCAGGRRSGRWPTRGSPWQRSPPPPPARLGPVGTPLDRRRPVKVARETTTLGRLSRGRLIFGASLRSNRHLNHAVHMAAVTQSRHSRSAGRAYLDKIAASKTSNKALRALKRRLSDVIYTRLRADAAAAHPPKLTVREVRGERLCLQRGRLTPRSPELRTSHSRTSTQPGCASPRRPVPASRPWASSAATAPW